MKPKGDCGCMKRKMSLSDWAKQPFGWTEFLTVYAIIISVFFGVAIRRIEVARDNTAATSDEIDRLRMLIHLSASNRVLAIQSSAQTNSIAQPKP